MCGIIAVLSRPETRPVPLAADLLAAVDSVLKGWPDDQQRLPDDTRLRDMAHVTSTKELELAQRDLLSLQKRKDELEELILTQLDKAEKEANRLTFLKNSLPLKKKQLAEGQAERKQQFEAEGASIERLKVERETLLGQLQPELKSAYQFAYQLHGERACLTVQDGGCPHCHLPIQPQFVVNILLGRSFHICQSCKRLVLPDRPLD